MKFKIEYLILGWLVVFNGFSVAAQQGKFKINGFRKDTACPIFITTNKKTEETFYDSRVVGYPKFFPGYIISLAGEKVEGNVAVFNDQSADWNFVKKCMLIVPSGEEEAQYIGGGVIAVIYQNKKKEEVYYDLYQGSYLERLVSGKIRLSYNPDANSSKKISSFVSQSFIDSLRSNTAKKSVREGLKEGKSLQESLEVAAAKDQLLSIGSAIEIVDKEYLLYDEQKGTTALVTKENYDEVILRLFGSCSAIDSKTAKKFSNKYDQIVDAIKEYNNSCN